MGFIKSAKKALRSGRGLSKRSTVKDLSKQSVDNESDGQWAEEERGSCPPPTQPRSVWNSKSRRGSSTLATVPEHPDEDDLPFQNYIDNSSDIGMGYITGKKTHIFIDMRTLTDSIVVDRVNVTEAPDGLSEIPSYFKTDNESRRGTPFRSQYNSKGYFTKPQRPTHQHDPRYSCTRNKRHPVKESPSVTSKRSHIRQVLAATEPQNDTVSAPDLSVQITGGSAMAILDDIIQSEVKLEVPYITRDNVDLSLPGGTVVTQKAPPRSKTTSSAAYSETQLPDTREDRAGIEEAGGPTVTGSNLGDLERVKTKPAKAVSFGSIATDMDSVASNATGHSTADPTSILPSARTPSGHERGPDETDPKVQTASGVDCGVGVDDSNSTQAVVTSDGEVKLSSHESCSRQQSKHTKKQTAQKATQVIALTSHNRTDIGHKVLFCDGGSKKSKSCHQLLTASAYDVNEIQSEQRLDVESVISNAANGEQRVRSSTLARVKAKINVLSSFLSSKKKQSKRVRIVEPNDDYASEDVNLDVEPLTKYLRLVRDDQTSYLALRDMYSLAASGSGFSSETDTENKYIPENPQSWNSLLELGRLYRNSQESLLPQESLMLQALNELGSKNWTSHPLYAKYEACEKYRRRQEERNKGPLQNIHLLKYGINIIAKQQPRSNMRGKPTTADPGVILTPMEQARGDAEAYIWSLTTVQLMKAKELVLHEFGQSEHSSRRWWISNKHCRYIRTNISGQNF